MRQIVGTILVRVFILPIAGLTVSQTALAIAHANDWYPEQQLARVLMTAPTLLQIEWVRWCLIALITLVLWAIADRLFYRRKPRRRAQWKGSLAWLAALRDFFGQQEIKEPIEWQWDYPIGARRIEHGIEIYQFQATGRNTTKEFISKIGGFVRSELTGATFPIRVQEQNSYVDPTGLGIPAGHQFHIAAPFVDSGGLSSAQFLRDFGRMTFQFEYDGKAYKRHFEFEELETEVRRTEEFLRPKITPSVAGVRRIDTPISTAHTAASLDAAIVERLLVPGWVLNFNPSNPKARKELSFNPDGAFGQGRNQNEYVWRVRNGLLEITRMNGNLQNLFRYDEKTNQFVCTNDALADGNDNQILARMGTLASTKLAPKSKLIETNRKATEAALLKCSFSMNDPGCNRPNTTIYSRPPIQCVWFRLKVEALGGTPVANCQGRLLEIKRGGGTVVGNERITLPFAYGEDPDSTAKTIHPGVPEFLDFLAISYADNQIIIPTKGALSQTIRWPEVFSVPGDHTMRIAIVSPSAPTCAVELLFRWTLNHATSKITCLTNP